MAWSDPFFCRVRIVEPYKELSMIHVGKVLIENGGFRVTNMEVSTRLWRETRYYFTIGRVWQSQGKG